MLSFFSLFGIAGGSLSLDGVCIFSVIHLSCGVSSYTATPHFDWTKHLVKMKPVFCF